MQTKRTFSISKEEDALDIVKRALFNLDRRRSGVTIIETTPDGRARALIAGSKRTLEADAIEELQALLEEY